MIIKPNISIIFSFMSLYAASHENITNQIMGHARKSIDITIIFHFSKKLLGCVFKTLSFSVICIKFSSLITRLCSHVGGA